MEIGRSMLSSSPPFPSRTHLRNCPSSSSTSVLMLHEQPAPSVASMATTSLAQHFPTSVLLRDQRDENKPFLHIMKEDKTSQVALDRRKMETGSAANEEYKITDSDQFLRDFQHQLFNWPGLWYLLPSAPSKTQNNLDVEPQNAVALAKKALSASKQAALLAEDALSFRADIHESLTPSSSSQSLGKVSFEEDVIVRSTRLLERRNKRRGVLKPKVTVHETDTSRREGLKRNISATFDPNDALQMFLRIPETKQLLTQKEESELIVQIQELMRLEEVKSRLQSQFDREPTLVEWAEAVGLSSRALKLQLHCGNSSREKLIYANFRMVVHIAKKYQGRGLNLQDLLQEGSMGLMRSVEKFKPQVGCRFASYSYWWIRQAVRKAIFQHSRTIRLPDSIYSLLRKVTEARRLCIQAGIHRPTKEEIAVQAGITVEKLEKVLFSVRTPLSLQQPIWTDQNTTFQEVTADTAIDMPHVSVEKQLMRRHVCKLLGILSPKERKIIRLRYGIQDGNPRSLSAIGAVFGLSKERVRQLESRALYKLKQNLDSQGLESYATLLF